MSEATIAEAPRTPYGAWLARHGITHAEVSSKVRGCSRQYSIMLAKGDATPGLQLALRLKDFSRAVAPEDPINIEECWRK